jgi:hypothetical protein
MAADKYRDRNGREVGVRLPTLEVPTTYCFDCGQMVPIADTWTKKYDPNYALCEACFRRAESAGRAKDGAADGKH